MNDKNNQRLEPKDLIPSELSACECCNRWAELAELLLLGREKGSGGDYHDRLRKSLQYVFEETEEVMSELMLEKMRLVRSSDPGIRASRPTRLGGSRR